MSRATLVFHEGLKDLLTSDHTTGRISYFLKRRASVKDVIESLGPPHTEIGLIVANNQYQDFSYQLRTGDMVDIYPHHPPVDVTQNSLLYPEPLPEITFIVDVNVGKLARLLRMLGFDTAYHWTWQDSTIANIAALEKRIVLTKDRGLLKRKKVQWGRLLRAETPVRQLREIRSFFGLSSPYAVFTRCLRCNTLLAPVDKQEIMHRLEPKTKKYFHHFQICPHCQRIYWRGSHHEKMRQYIQEVDCFYSGCSSQSKAS
jgi:hypothetical protein